MSKPAKILCIDDEPDVLYALQRFLGRQYDVTTESDPAKGLEMGLTGNYNLLILDLAMPGISGMDIAAKLLKEKVHCRCILLTAFADACAIQQVVNNPIIFHYSMKPWVDESLLNTVVVALATLE